MPVPGHDAFLLPFLKLISDGEPSPIRALIPAIADEPKLSEVQRAELPPSGQRMVEAVYAQLTKQVTSDLPEALKSTSPCFFEKATVELLRVMGDSKVRKREYTPLAQRPPRAKNQCPVHKASWSVLKPRPTPTGLRVAV